MASRSKWGVAGLLLVGLCVTSVADTASRLRGRGSLSGQVTLTQLGSRQTEVNLDLSGNVTHLGKSRVELQTVADFTKSAPQSVRPSKGEITAANGDTVQFHLQWAAKPQAAGVFEVTGTFKIDGGTGRFTQARGRGDYRSRVDTNTGRATAEITGVLMQFL